jgi:nuclear GTP-binding protein
MNLLTTESFSETFGSKSRRKRPKLTVTDVGAMASAVGEATAQYNPAKDSSIKVESDMREEASHVMFKKGQSNRIWTELYKVVDCSDVVVQVLDARDPAGTRSLHIESYLKKHAKHKNLIFILNKCDLVPTWVTVRVLMTVLHAGLAFI